MYSQVTVTCDAALPSWRWLNACLPTGSRELMPCFAMLVCPAYALPIKLSLPETTSSHLHPSDFLPNPDGVEVRKQQHGADCWLGLNYNTFLSSLKNSNKTTDPGKYCPQCNFPKCINIHINARVLISIKTALSLQTPDICHPGLCYFCDKWTGGNKSY